MTKTTRRILLGLCTAVLAMTVLASAQDKMPQTTKERIAGAATVKTEELNGTVIQVEDNHLAVRMSTGGIRTFDVPPSRRFVIDGKELTVQELKPGTRLHATITTTTTPVTERTTTVGSGKVWFVSGNNVILTLPNNENRQYKVAEHYQFVVDGKKATVYDLRKGMIISAEKIVEEPKTEIASNVAVTGEAPPPPKPKVAEAPRTVTAPAPAPAPAAAPAPAPAAAEPQAERAAEPPAELPKTGSMLPLAGLLGLLSIALSMAVRAVRQS